MCINQQFWNKYLYKVTGRIHMNIGEFANYSHKRKHKHERKIICSKQVKLRWFWIDFLRLYLWVIITEWGQMLSHEF